MFLIAVIAKIKQVWNQCEVLTTVTLSTEIINPLIFFTVLCRPISITMNSRLCAESVNSLSNTYDCLCLESEPNTY
jgi:hypothetical protein